MSVQSNDSKLNFLTSSDDVVSSNKNSAANRNNSNNLSTVQIGTGQISRANSIISSDDDSSVLDDITLNSSGSLKPLLPPLSNEVKAKLDKTYANLRDKIEMSEEGINSLHDNISKVADEFQKANKTDELHELLNDLDVDGQVELHAGYFMKKHPINQAKHLAPLHQLQWSAAYQILTDTFKYSKDNANKFIISLTSHECDVLFQSNLKKSNPKNSDLRASDPKKMTLLMSELSQIQQNEGLVKNLSAGLSNDPKAKRLTDVLDARVQAKVALRNQGVDEADLDVLLQKMSLDKLQQVQSDAASIKTRNKKMLTQRTQDRDTRNQLRRFGVMGAAQNQFLQSGIAGNSSLELLDVLKAMQNEVANDCKDAQDSAKKLQDTLVEFGKASDALVAQNLFQDALNADVLEMEYLGTKTCDELKSISEAFDSNSNSNNQIIANDNNNKDENAQTKLTKEISEFIKKHTAQQ